MDEKKDKDRNADNQDSIKNLKAAALRYDPENDRAPYIVASGSGYAAQRILKTAIENGIAIYHDDSAATMLAKLQSGKEIPPELYQIVVDIYLILLETADSTLKHREALEKQRSIDPDTKPQPGNNDNKSDLTDTKPQPGNKDNKSDLTDTKPQPGNKDNKSDLTDTKPQL